MISAVPITISAANAVVSKWHRHNKPVVGALFAIGAEFDEALVGIVIVGRPIARNLVDGRTAEVTRACTVPSAPKGCNGFLYAAAWRAWRAMGGRRLITYTLQSESGASLRGSGWSVVAEVTGSQGWSRLSRQRVNLPISQQPKLRWQIGEAR